MLGICIRECYLGPQLGLVCLGEVHDIDPASPEAVCFDFEQGERAKELARIADEAKAERDKILSEIHKQILMKPPEREPLSALDQFIQDAFTDGDLTNKFRL